MIAFARRAWWKRLLRLVPAIRRQQDAELRGAIEQLVDDPDLPCSIEGIVIANGRGSGGEG